MQRSPGIQAAVSLRSAVTIEYELRREHRSGLEASRLKLVRRPRVCQTPCLARVNHLLTMSDPLSP